MKKHLLTRIVRDSILDGPGCRYVVFVKGCNLRCKWCHNPETQSPEQQIMFYPQFCIECDKCEKEKLKGVTDEIYFRCVEDCPSNALEFAAKEYTTKWLINDMLKYQTMYRQTGGGLTISGGEPLFAKEFSFELFKESKYHRFHTAIDTNGTFEWKILKQFLPVVDLWLYDFKHPNDNSVFSDLSISNLNKLINHEASIWLRIPVIPGYNDSEKILTDMAKIVGNMVNKVKKVFLLPFHPYGESKYQALGKQYFYSSMKPDDSSIERAKSIFLQYIPNTLLQTGRSMFS
ncbi:pyruvate formate lyase activating enzyme [Candidatus Magnetomoraceae bacterium gMMP-1]